MKFTEKLNTLIAERSLNRRKFAIASGIPYGTIDNWYKRSYENMSIATFKTLCAFFGVTMESMAYDDREIEYARDASPEDFDAQERALARTFRRLDERGKRTVENAAEAALLEVTAQDARLEETA